MEEPLLIKWHANLYDILSARGFFSPLLLLLLSFFGRRRFCVVRGNERASHISLRGAEAKLALWQCDLTCRDVDPCLALPLWARCMREGNDMPSHCVALCRQLTSTERSDDVRDKTSLPPRDFRHKRLVRGVAATDVRRQ